MACEPNYNFSIDDHTMTVIEADGVNHQPIPVDQIDIFAGEYLSGQGALVEHRHLYLLKGNAIRL